MNKATNPKTIGPLKRHDDSLAVDDTEKANMMNMFFSTVGQNLAMNFPALPQHVSHQDPLAVATVPVVSDIYLTNDEIENGMMELFLIQLTETWRKEIDNGLVVGRQRLLIFKKPLIVFPTLY